MKNFQMMIAELVASAAGGAAAEYLPLIAAPPKPEMGDYALPCFSLAKKLKNDPKKIAADLAAGISPQHTPFTSVSADGPYLNFRLDDAKMAEAVLSAIATEAESFGFSDLGQGRTVVIDYSSPNIAKPFHIGHLRSTVIGSALYRIYGALGYKPVGINHLGDWGTQFGMVMAAFDEDRNEDALNREPIAYSLKLYVDYNKKSEADGQAREIAKDWFKRLEQGDAAAGALWNRFRDLSIAKFEKIYRRLGVRFDHYTGESFYNDKMEAAFELVRKSGILQRAEDGAEMVLLEDFGMPPFILKKSDGATLYATREIAAALYRFETFQPELMLYVVGTPQELHFRQFIQVIRLMGCGFADRIVHVKFGHVLGMSTRKGEVVLLEDVLDEAAAKAREKIEENIAAGKLDPEVDREALAEAVGMAALIAHDLKHRRERDIQFDWDHALQFDGETGPYLQYTYARIRGIMRKAEKEGEGGVDFAGLCEPETRALVRVLADFPDAVQKAAQENEPSLVTTCLFEITKAFNAFYNRRRVIGSGDKEPARLLLVSCTGRVIRNGLELLGLPVLEKM